ncbi:MAG: hypothetical protein M3460_24605 [Actinomycetota bacterium]|nr:hypothetical protein [Actinomycetota bacterium]
MDPFGQYAQIVDSRRTWHTHPGAAPPAPSPECAPRHRQSPAGIQHNPHPRPPDGPAICATAYGEAVTLPRVQCGPPRPPYEKPTSPMAPPAYGHPGGTALRGRYPPLHKPKTAQAGHKPRQGRPTRPTHHYPLHELEEATDDHLGDHHL